MRKLEIWSDNYGDVVVMDVTSDPDVFVGFNTIQEAKQDYPTAVENLDEMYDWNDYEG